MKFWKNVFKYLLVLFSALSISLGVHAAGGKLIDVLVNQSGVLEVLGKQGISGNEASEVSEFIQLSLKDLSYGQKLSASELQKTIKALTKNGTDQDISYARELSELLEKPADQISKEELVKAIDNLIYIANRFGIKGSTLASCAKCVNEGLASHGFKFAIETVNNKTAKAALKGLPRDPRSLRGYISKKMSKFGLGDFSKVTDDMVHSTEEKSLGLYFKLMSEGNKKQKRLAKAVSQVSEEDGKAVLFSKDNNHKLWTLFTEDMSDDIMDSWSEMLEEVGKRADDTPGASRKAFYDYLDEKAGDNAELRSHVQALKRKNCFFE